MGKRDEILPFAPTHPGSILGKELEARGIKQKDFAGIIGMQPSNLSSIIHGKRNVTEETAIKFEQALGIPFQVWMNLQNRYTYVVKMKQELQGKTEEQKEIDRLRKENRSLRSLLKRHGISFDNIAL